MKTVLRSYSHNTVGIESRNEVSRKTTNERCETGFSLVLFCFFKFEKRMKENSIIDFVGERGSAQMVVSWLTRADKYAGTHLLPILDVVETGRAALHAIGLRITVTVVHDDGGRSEACG
jgi:hypothetical protein